MKIKKILADKYFVAKAYIAAIIICWPIMGIVNFAIDKILIRTGNMPSVTYDIRQTETVAMAEKEGIYYSTDGDPQIIVYFEKPIYITSVEMDIQYNGNPGETVMYYAQKPGQGFSERKREFSNSSESDKLIFNIGRKKMTMIRIDPAMYAGVGMDIKGIRINNEKGFLEYFIPGYTHVFIFAVVTTFLFSALLIFRDVFLTDKKFTESRKVSKSH